MAALDIIQDRRKRVPGLLSRAFFFVLRATRSFTFGRVTSGFYRPLGRPASARAWPNTKETADFLTEQRTRRRTFVIITV